jgi:hypothetical protein
MNLGEQTVIGKNAIDLDSFNETIANSLRAAHEYGKNMARFNAIRFAEWIAGEGWRNYDSNETWICLGNSNEVITTVDLYDRFEHRNDWKTRLNKN